MQKRLKGFTLIEMLIVIAIIGALAAGLLAAMDPFEQLKKGRDTATRSTASAFFNALVGYNAQRGDFPWQGLGGATAPGFSTTFTTGATTTLNLPGGKSIINALVTAGELKPNFDKLAGDSRLLRINLAWTEAAKIAVCFLPESKAVKNDQNNIFNATGSTSPIATGTCPSATTESCYTCFR